jgi:two-component system, cell cycle sensor histidine kinase and response regulator CckA
MGENTPPLPDTLMHTELFRRAHDSIILLDDEDTIIQANESAAAAYGNAALAGLPISRLAAFGEADSQGEALRAALANGGAVFTTAHRRQDGSVFPVEVSAAPLAACGRARAVLIIRDVSGRPGAEEARRASEEKMRRIVEGAAEGLVVVQGDRIVMANPCALKLFGATAREVAEANWLAYTWPEDRPIIEQRNHQRLAGIPVSESVSYRLCTAAGEPVPVEAHTRLIPWEGGLASLVFITDLRERVKAEEERARLRDSLQQARRLEAIGLLAGGVAHDFNNMLAAILGYAELLGEELPAGSRRLADLEEIVKAAGRSRDLVSQLLAFARQQTLNLKPLDLGAVVMGIQPLLRRALRENVDLRTRLGAGLPAISGDRGQVEQVLLNLAMNAQDAMPSGGVLLIETSTARMDDSGPGKPGIAPGTYIILTVSDTGKGMDQETLERVFEPFFTTKEAGKGTGLGLATVYGVMQQHRGGITAYSEPGHGSTFRAYFPAAEGPAAAEGAPVPGAPRGGTETVLVVEDQDQTRPLVCEMLRRRGYLVLEAANGEGALAAAAAHEGPINLLVTDVILGTINGRELAERLCALRPETRVLYMSGYANDIISSHGVLTPGTHFIQKPFALQDFTEKVRAVLDNPAGA